MHILKHNGRATLVLPDGTLFGEGVKSYNKTQPIHIEEFDAEKAWWGQGDIGAELVGGRHLNQIAIYQSEGGAVDVRLDGETVWLTQEQMAQLFVRERSVITKHIRNVFKEGELEGDSVCADFAHTANDGKSYQVLYYSLDVVISVGYRVKSPQGVQFRQWATRLLRQHLTQGYTVNQQRLEANAAELEAALELVRKAAQTPELSADTGRGLVDIVTRYAHTFLWLQRYDEGLLADPHTQPGGTLPTLAQAREALAQLRSVASSADRTVQRCIA